MTCVPLCSSLDGSRLCNNIKGHPGLIADFASGKCKITVPFRSIRMSHVTTLVDLFEMSHLSHVTQLLYETVYQVGNPFVSGIFYSFCFPSLSIMCQRCLHYNGILGNQGKATKGREIGMLSYL